MAIPVILVAALGVVPFLGRNLCAEDVEWQEKKSTHFIVYSAPDIEKGYVDKVISTAEKYYHSLEDKLGFRRFNYWTWEKRVKIYIYSDKASYLEVSGRPEWSGGSVDIANKIIESYYWEDFFFERMLPHELAHIVFREYIGQKTSLPLWLDEGFACFNEQDYSQRYVRRVLLWVKNGKAPIDYNILNDFTQQGIHTAPSESSMAHYYYSVSLVDYLWQAFGRDKFRKFCKAIKEEGNSAQEALFSVYQFKDTGELNKGWTDYLLSQREIE